MLALERSGRQMKAASYWFGVVGIGVVLCVSGCAVKDTAIDEPYVDELTHDRLLGDPDFNWHLSGDRRVAPRQVFSDAHHVWIQWHPHQAIPTVFARAGDDWQVVTSREQGPYTIIEGRWSELRFQGAQLRAHAHHRPRTDCAGPQPSSQDSGGRRFELRLADRTIRQALNRWAIESDWYFDDAHWTLPVDLPVTATASFKGDFPGAVEQLLHAVEAAGRPARPCFYANHVLRVIPKTAACEPGQGPGDGALGERS